MAKIRDWKHNVSTQVKQWVFIRQLNWSWIAFNTPHFHTWDVRRHTIFNNVHTSRIANQLLIPSPSNPHTSSSSAASWTSDYPFRQTQYIMHIVSIETMTYKYISPIFSFDVEPRDLRSNRTNREHLLIIDQHHAAPRDANRSIDHTHSRNRIWSWIERICMMRLQAICDDVVCRVNVCLNDAYVKHIIMISSSTEMRQKHFARCAIDRSRRAKGICMYICIYKMRSIKQLVSKSRDFQVRDCVWFYRWL